MKIIFIGTVEFSKQALTKIINLGGEVVGVMTRESSAFNADFADLSAVCKEHDIDVLYTKDVNADASLNWAKEKQPDIVFCFGWSSLIKTELLNMPRLGVVGYHPTELPYNRGRHPIIWALALGLRRTASTFFFMDEGADSGDILSQAPIEIQLEDTAATLYDKVVNVALKQIELFFPKLISGDYVSIVQDHSKSNTWRKRSKPDGRIDFRMPSFSIYNLVRALTKPYLGAHVETSHGDITIWSSRLVEGYESLINIEPGKILACSKNEIIVKTSDGAIALDGSEFKEFPKVGAYL